MAAINTDTGRDQAYHPCARMVLRAADNEKIPLGAIVSNDATGYAQNATATANLVCLGICAEECDNSAGAQGDLDVKVLTGLFWVPNSVTNAVTQAHMDEVCYVENNNAVSSSSSGTHVAGYVRGLSGSNVLVAFGIGDVK